METGLGHKVINMEPLAWLAPLGPLSSVQGWIYSSAMTEITDPKERETQ